MKPSIIAAILVTAASAGAAQAETVMRCSHQLPPGHHIALVVDKWAAEVEAQSEGSIDVQVFAPTAWSKPMTTFSPSPRARSNAPSR